MSKILTDGGFKYIVVRKLMNEKKLTYFDMLDFFYSKGVNMAIETIQSWFRKNDKIRTAPNAEKIILIAEFLGVSVNEILNQNSDFSPVRFIPIVGEASCGLPISSQMQESDRKSAYNGDFWTPNLYCVIASGDSMSPDIDDGDEIICDPNAEILSGDIVHYIINGESAVKVFFENKELNAFEFIPYNQNENFKTKYIKKDSLEVENLQISKVVSINKLRLNNRTARLKKLGKA